MMITCKLAPDVVVIACCLPLVTCFAIPAFALLFISLPELSTEELVIVSLESLVRVEQGTMDLPRPCRTDEDCLRMTGGKTICVASMKQWRSAEGEPI